jgi:hypothetical protein
MANPVLYFLSSPSYFTSVGHPHVSSYLGDGGIVAIWGVACRTFYWIMSRAAVDPGQRDVAF